MDRQVELRPPPRRPDLAEALERAIAQHLLRTIYLPLLKILDEPISVLENSDETELARAIRQGRIRYFGGAFEGRFTAAISRALEEAGAKWDRKRSRWKLPESKLTYEMRAAIEVADEKFRALAAKLESRLARIIPEELAEDLNVGRILDTSITTIAGDADDVLKRMVIEANFTEEQARRIREQYAENLRLGIRDWADEEILNLRETMKKSTLRGVRYEEMVGHIQRSYGVSKSKAQFLARQETNLLTAEIRESRYRDAGITEYRWRCVAGSSAHPVRPRHKALDGKIFSWDHPPIVDDQGNRKHPGQDYNCRCIAIPVVRF